MTMDEKMPVTAKDVETWIRGRIGEFVHQDITTIAPAASFESFGIDSAKAISLMTDLEETFRLEDELPLELLFEAESIGEAAQSIAAAINEMTGKGSAFGQFQ